MDKQYIISGILRNGKRFKSFTTTTPQHYNIWCGTCWEVLANGKRKKVFGWYN